MTSGGYLGRIRQISWNYGMVNASGLLTQLLMKYGLKDKEMNKSLAIAALVVLVATGCGREGTSMATESEPLKPMLLVREDLITVRPESLAQGPVIAGSLQPELRADLRAEVSGIVLEVLKDNGDEVAKGELLLRIDSTALRDNLLSAQEAERAAEAALDQAERQYKRMQTMVEKGLVAVETVETAEGTRNQAQSGLASARARVVETRQMLEKTEVRAPFDGVVGARSVSPGNTVQVGRELLQVLDIGTMRFEGMIAADEVGKVRTGATVHFRVNGFPGQEFAGTVERTNPVANQATRQVQVLVSLPKVDVSFVAGLYAEGRIEVQSRPVIMLPESALIRDGEVAHVWTVNQGELKREDVVLGEQDPRLGRIEISSGLAIGDEVLRHPLGVLQDGRQVEIDGPGTSVAENPVAGQTQDS
jgi:membrane fusion protein (multidrug efflux system)